MPQPSQLQGQGPPVRRPTMAEMNERMTSLRGIILQHEAMLQQMNQQHQQTQNGGQADPQLIGRMRQMMMSVREKKEQLQRLVIMANNMYVLRPLVGEFALINSVIFFSFLGVR